MNVKGHRQNGAVMAQYVIDKIFAPVNFAVCKLDHSLSNENIQS